jgi:hypothetical protein
MDFDKLTAEQRLVAEQAVLTFQALERAARDAPQGQGMAKVESALHEKGFEHLRQMLKLAVGAHEGAQKGGPAVCLAPVARTPPTGGGGINRS